MLFVNLILPQKSICNNKINMHYVYMQLKKTEKETHPLKIGLPYQTWE